MQEDEMQIKLLITCFPPLCSNPSLSDNTTDFLFSSKKTSPRRGGPSGDRKLGEGCSSQSLIIFPNQKQQTVAVGKSVVLTCQADAPDPALVTQPQWRDPKGLIIREAASPPEQPKWREAISSESLIHGKYADRYELQWKVPAHNGEPIDMYEVSYCPVLKVSGEWRVSAESDCVTEELKSYEAINYEVRGLHPDTRYRMHVRAHNVLGYSLPAQLYVQTALGVERSGFAPPQLLSSGAIIGLALAGVLICLIVVDLLLLCFRRQGVIATICGKRVKKHSDDEAKLGRDEKEPLKETGDDALKRNSSVEFDGRRVYATSGGTIIGKNSAV
ncbi:unnamed protein product [Euphydryas editha]|uniref:Fibronectin type-III domain-containing protein n=1 Tax=Euphydryas editha TaxID=104508 RepID=A0AAU9TTV7_EUPED|nr:unnamed protein product [Euphydryas editha]